MPIRIVEAEKEGHRKVKTDFRKKRQKDYMEKHGVRPPRRKTLGVTDKYKEVREKLTPFKPLRASKAFGGAGKVVKGGLKHVFEQLGGDEKAKPHSTKKGRTASGRRRFKRIIDKVKPGPNLDRPDFRPKPKLKPRPLPQPGRPLSPEDWRRRIEPRTKKGLGSLVQKVISGVGKIIKPKPKGKGLGSGIKPSEMKDIIPKKDRKAYLKEKLANPLPNYLRGPSPHRKVSSSDLKKLDKKAAGGRIGLQHGARPRPQGPHVPYRPRPYGPRPRGVKKIQIKGW